MRTTNYNDYREAIEILLKIPGFGSRFPEFLAHACKFPIDYLEQIRELGILTEQILRSLGENGSPGGFDVISFDVISFAQIGHSPGFFGAARGARHHSSVMFQPGMAQVVVGI